VGELHKTPNSKIREKRRGYPRQGLIIPVFTGFGQSVPALAGQT
jgi:hypothetical protein